MTKAEAEADFRKRIAAYESVYQTISEPEISFCRILNVGRQVTINKIEGYLQSRIAFYLMNLHLKPRNIYLSRVSWLARLRNLADRVARRINVQCRRSNWWRFRSVTTRMEIRSSLASSYQRECRRGRQSWGKLSAFRPVEVNWPNRSGHQRSSGPCRLPRTSNSKRRPGNHSTNSMQVYVTEWHMRRLR